MIPPLHFEVKFISVYFLKKIEINQFMKFTSFKHLVNKFYLKKGPLRPDWIFSMPALAGEMFSLVYGGKACFKMGEMKLRIRKWIPGVLYVFKKVSKKFQKFLITNLSKTRDPYSDPDLGMPNSNP